MNVTVLGLLVVVVWAMLCFNTPSGRVHRTQSALYVTGLVLFLALLVVTSTPCWLYLICLTAVLSLMSRPSLRATGTQL